MQGEERTSSSPSSAAFTAVALVVACILAAIAIVWHARADSAFRASRVQGIPLRTRLAAAHEAAALEPWNNRYAAREHYVEEWLRADALLAEGDYKDAVSVLTAIVGRTLAEPDLLALYRKAQAIQTVETNRKAHLQHGHEGPGGTLTPSDIER